MPGRIDVEQSRAMQATLLALRAAPREVRANVRRYTKSLVEPEYQRQVRERAIANRAQARVIGGGARIQISDQNVRMRTAASTRPLSGGLVPNKSGAALEFGSNQRTRTRYWRTTAGTRHLVTRNTTAQLPKFRKRGWAFWPTVVDLTPRIAALWAQTAIRTVHDALEGRIR